MLWVSSAHAADRVRHIVVLRKWIEVVLRAVLVPDNVLESKIICNYYINPKAEIFKQRGTLILNLRSPKNFMSVYIEQSNQEAFVDRPETAFVLCFLLKMPKRVLRFLDLTFF